MDNASSPYNFSGMTEEEYVQTVFDKMGLALLPSILVLVAIIVGGVLGNGLVFVVYLRQFRPSSTRVFVLAMSAYDLLTNVVTLPMVVVIVRHAFVNYDRWFCATALACVSFFSVCTGWILCFVAADRQRRVCHPQKQQFSPRQAWLFVLLATGLSAIVTFPFFHLKGVQRVKAPGADVTISTCAVEDAFLGTAFYTVYKLSVGLTFVAAITMLVVCYSLIGRHVWLHTRKQRALQGKAGGAGAVRVVVEADSGSGSGGEAGGGSSSKQDDTQSTGISSDTDTPSKTPAAAVVAARKTGGGLGLAAISLSLQRGLKLGSSSRKLSLSSLNDAVAASKEDNSLADRHREKSSHKHETKGENSQDTDSKAGSCQVVDSADDVGSETDTSMPSDSDAASAPNDTSSCVDTARCVATPPPGKPRVSTRPGSLRKVALGRNRPPSKRGAKRKIHPSRTTLTMGVLTVAVIINYLPHLVVRYVHEKPGFFLNPELTVLSLNLYMLAMCSLYLNSAVNPIAYSFCNARFRQECRQLKNRLKKRLLG